MALESVDGTLLTSRVAHDYAFASIYDTQLPAPTTLTVVLNWYEELTTRLPTE